MYATIDQIIPHATVEVTRYGHVDLRILLIYSIDMEERLGFLVGKSVTLI